MTIIHSASMMRSRSGSLGRSVGRDLGTSSPRRDRHSTGVGRLRRVRSSPSAGAGLVTAGPRARVRSTALLGLICAFTIGCGGGVGQLAKETCAELEGAIVLQAGPILSKAIAKAGDMGSDAPTLGAAMRAECPSIMAAIEKVGTDAQEKEDLPTKMSVDVQTCSDENATGTVTNNSSSTVDIFISAQFLDASGTVLDDGIDSVNGVRAGETAKWDARYLGAGDVARCRANVSSAFPQ